MQKVIKDKVFRYFPEIQFTKNNTKNVYTKCRMCKIMPSSFYYTNVKSAKTSF